MYTAILSSHYSIVFFIVSTTKPVNLFCFYNNGLGGEVCWWCHVKKILSELFNEIWPSGDEQDLEERGHCAPSYHSCKARIHIISKWSWLPVMAGIRTVLPLLTLHSASANAIMCWFGISNSPLGLLNTAGAVFRQVASLRHFFIYSFSKIGW